MTERLIVLAAESADAGLADIRKRGRVLSTLPPRLVIADLDDEQTNALRASPTTLAVMGSPADSVPDALSEGERLFADAWRTRHQSQDKLRIGDGLPWDAEGFEPPDRPKR